MATAVTAVTTAPLPPTATAPAAAAEGPTDLFSTVLGTAVAGANATSLSDDTGLVDDVAADVLADPRTTDQNALALAAAGVLVVVPGITPAAPQALPTVDPDAAAVGVTTVTSDDLPGLPADTRSRAEQLRFQLAAGLQNGTPLTQPPGDRTPPAPQPEAVPAQPAATEAPRPAPAAPTVATPADPLPNGPRAARVPTIPAQVPVVTDAVVVSPAPAPLTPPDTTVEAASAVAGLPGAVIGDRPSTAGERFEALASAGARLAATAPAAPAVPFAAVARDVAATATTPVVTEPAAAEVSTGRAAREQPAPPEPTRDADLSAFGAAPVAAPVAPQTTDAPPAVARAAPAAPAAVQLADGVAAHARTLAATGEVEFRMRLDPPDLGQVRVNLIGSGEHVRGELVVADDAVRRMIESQLPELRQRLEAAGVTVQRFDVTTDPTGGGANPNGGRADRTPADPPAPAAPRAARPWSAAPAPTGGLDVTV